MVLFKSRDTFLILPSVGFVVDGGWLRMTLMLANYGLSFRLFRV